MDTQRPIRRRRRGERGQAIVLGATMMIVVCLCLFVTLNILRTVHERIRIQHVADAQAYSLAVQEARAYNFFAYTNRAIAGALVSMAVLHAYMSEMSAATDAYFWMGIWFLTFVGREVKKSKCPKTCFCFVHCIHAIDDLIQGIILLASSSKLGKELRSVDGSMRKAVDAFQGLIDSMLASQSRMVNIVQLTLMPGGISQVKQMSAPQASNFAMGLAAMNINKFKSPFEDDESHLRKVMNDAANAQRTDWLKQRMLPYNRIAPGAPAILPFPVHVLEPMEKKLKNKCKCKELYIFQFPFLGGKAGITKGTGSASAGKEADTVGSKDWWMLKFSCKHHTDINMIWALPFFFVNAEVHSNKDSGKHPRRLLFSAHDGNDHKISDDDFKGFKEFKPDPNSELMSQPPVYAHVSQDLRVNEKGKLPVWEIAPNGSLQFGQLRGGGAKLQISDNKKGTAVGKALVYYHRPIKRSSDGSPDSPSKDNPTWKEQPNFWHPYWRAKLHPFRGSEAAQVLGAAMNFQSAMAAPMVTP